MAVRSPLLLVIVAVLIVPYLIYTAAQKRSAMSAAIDTARSDGIPAPPAPAAREAAPSPDRCVNTPAALLPDLVLIPALRAAGDRLQIVDRGHASTGVGCCRQLDSRRLVEGLGHPGRPDARGRSCMADPGRGDLGVVRLDQRLRAVAKWRFRGPTSCSR